MRAQSKYTDEKVADNNHQKEQKNALDKNIIPSQLFAPKKKTGTLLETIREIRKKHFGA